MRLVETLYEAGGRFLIFEAYFYRELVDVNHMLMDKQQAVAINLQEKFQNMMVCVRVRYRVNAQTGDVEILETEGDSCGPTQE